MDYSKAEKLLKLSKAGGTDKDLIFLDELEEISDTLKNLKINDTEFPDLQKVEVTNFPEQKEIPTPIVNVPAPIVNVETPIVNVPAPIVNVNPTPVNIDTTDLLKSIDKLYEKDILKDVINDGRVKVEVDRVGYGGVVTFPIVDALNKTSYLSSTSTNGTRDLTSANTWYAVPSTVPTSPYILVATIETAVGTVRWGFDNTGTPSATNGNQAPYQLTVRLAGNQSVYFASSTAGDDVNWTCKVI